MNYSILPCVMFVTFPAILHKDQTVIKEEKVISMEKYRGKALVLFVKYLDLAQGSEFRNVRRKKTHSTSNPL